MKQIELRPLPKQIIIKTNSKPFHLSSLRKNEIEKYWIDINKDNKFHRGEVFSVNSIQENEEVCEISLWITDYAHYLHTVRNNISDHEACRVVYGAGLVETKDHFFVFGEMGGNTAYSGRLQCVGGGLSFDDLKGDFFDLKGSVLRELSEEIGLTEKELSQITSPFLKTGGTYDFVVILYHLKTIMTKNDLITHYNTFCQNIMSDGQEPELSSLIFLENHKEKVEQFLQKDARQKVDYLAPLLLALAN